MSTIRFYCISLISRHDRRLKSNLEFRRLNIPITWWIVEPHPQGGKYGCFESHVNIWDKNEADIAVIFEDDVKFDGTSDEFWEFLHEAIRLSEKCDTVHLGNIPYQIGDLVSENYYRGKFLTASCYLGRKNNLKKLGLQAKIFYGCHVDVFLSQYAQQIGLLGNRFEQDFSDSNNNWLKDIPVIENLSFFDGWIRKSLILNPYCLSHVPLINGVMKLVIGLNTLQRTLPRILYDSEIEFQDRRV